MIVQPETVLRWRRSRGRWRGGRPKVSREVRDLITRMARQNFLWGAPRIHGELLKLGFKVSQATVSRYLRTSGRRPGLSWRTFLRSQAVAFAHHQYSDQNSEAEDAGPWSRVMRPVAPIGRSNADRVSWRHLGTRVPTARVSGLRSRQSVRRAPHYIRRRCASSGRPPHQARASLQPGRGRLEMLFFAWSKF